MPRLPLYHVDAFAAELYSGNPAAVCPLSEWLPDSVLQAIARENNLSETAFFLTGGPKYPLRWFTPGGEVDLCGHATLATAFVLYRYLEAPGNRLEFHTRSGAVWVQRDGERLTLDFPSRPPVPCPAPGALVEGLGGNPEAVLRSRDYFVLYRTEAEVRALRPDFGRLSGLDCLGTIVTAPGDECDFVSRFFAPDQGIPEDPVTGSAHCTLVPYWAERLGKEVLHARQVSQRGGELFCRLRGDRVEIGGSAVCYLEGEILLP